MTAKIKNDRSRYISRSALSSAPSSKALADQRKPDAERAQHILKKLGPLGRVFVKF